MKGLYCNPGNSSLNIHCIQLRSNSTYTEFNTKRELLSPPSSRESTDDEFSVPLKESNKDLFSILQNIEIPQNPLCEVSTITEGTILKLSKANNLSEVKELNLSNLGLSHIFYDNWITEQILKSIESLDLSGNYIKSLDGIFKCTKLRHLNISNNLIEDLTPLAKVPNLRILIADNNQITSIYPLKKCTKLKHLIIDYNRLYSFDSTLKVLKGLEELTILEIYYNPCMIKTANSKEQLICNCSLGQLDGEILSDEAKISAYLTLKSKSRVSKKNKTQSFERKKYKLHQKEDLDSQLFQLEKENAKLKKELSKAWAILDYVTNI